MSETENGFDPTKPFTTRLGCEVGEFKPSPIVANVWCGKVNGFPRVWSAPSGVSLKGRQLDLVNVAPPVTDTTEAGPVARIAESLKMALACEGNECNWREEANAALLAYWNASPEAALRASFVSGKPNEPLVTEAERAAALSVWTEIWQKGETSRHDVIYLSLEAAAKARQAALRASAPDPVATPEFEWQWRVSPQYPWTFAISEAEATNYALACNGEYRRTPSLRASAPEPADASGMTPLDHEARAIFRVLWGRQFGGVATYEDDEVVWKEAAMEVRKVRGPSASGAQSDVWRHVKTGGEYDVVAKARLQTANVMELADMNDMVIYRSRKDGSVWVRSSREFQDGRFVPVPPTLTPPEGTAGIEVQEVTA